MMGVSINGMKIAANRVMKLGFNCDMVSVTMMTMDEKYTWAIERDRRLIAKENSDGSYDVTAYMNGIKYTERNGRNKMTAKYAVLASGVSEEEAEKYIADFNYQSKKLSDECKNDADEIRVSYCKTAKSGFSNMVRGTRTSYEDHGLVDLYKDAKLPAKRVVADTGSLMVLDCKKIG